MRLGFISWYVAALSLGSLHTTGAQSFQFQHHSIANPLPGRPEYGTGGFTLADLDGDGDLDITICRRPDSTNAYWYAFDSGKWVQHRIGRTDGEQLGAASSDINRDGFPDLIMGRMWYENPGKLIDDPDRRWILHRYHGLDHENHDIVAADLNNDGIRDIICYAQRHEKGTLQWYDPTNPTSWVGHKITAGLNDLITRTREGSNGIHGGFAPAGIGDLDQDGYADIIMPTGWYKNPGSGQQEIWQHFPWPFAVGIIPNPYGISIRSWIIDLDGDGDNDVVYTDCDVQGSRGYWIENNDGGMSFTRHPLPSPGDPTGSFHSLAVMDFDQDGDLDIFSGEQEDPSPGMKERGLRERGFIWENTGTPTHPEFVVRILQIDNPGWHEVQAGDVDHDGDIDLVSKVWNKDGAAYHADFWENLLMRSPTGNKKR